MRQIEIFEGCKRSSLSDDLALDHEAEHQTMHVEYMVSALTAWKDKHYE